MNIEEKLDDYDFSEFLTEGRSLFDTINAIEEKYDKEFKKKYGIYMFDELDWDDIINYFNKKYNVWFQEYSDWIVRHIDGRYAKTEKRR